MINGSSSQTYPPLPRDGLDYLCLFLTAASSISSITQQLIELPGLISRNAQRLPVRGSEMFCQENNLPDVIRVMGQLPIDCLQDCMNLAANRYSLVEVFGRQRLYRIKHALPASLPVSKHIVTRGC